MSDIDRLRVVAQRIRNAPSNWWDHGGDMTDDEHELVSLCHPDLILAILSRDPLSTPSDGKRDGKRDDAA